MVLARKRHILGVFSIALCLLLLDAVGPGGPLPGSNASAATSAASVAKASKRTTRVVGWPSGRLRVQEGSSLKRVRISGPAKRRVKVKRRAGGQWKTVRVVRTSKTKRIKISFMTKRPGRWRLRVPARRTWAAATTKPIRVVDARSQPIRKAPAEGTIPTSPPATTPVRTPTPTPTLNKRQAPQPPASGEWWAPAKGTSWQWQLSGAIDTSVDAEVFDIDGEDATAATVAALHAKGAKVICYFDAGAWENYRSDADSFPERVKGNTVGGWPDEKWLDIRQLDVLIPIMEKRVQDCANKGFDALEPDLMDGFSNKTGFPLTYQDQLNYNRALADLGHKYGLGVALKNDPEQAKDLAEDLDFVIVEECAQYDECAMYKPFSDAGKAVLHVEYQGTLGSFCPSTKSMGFSSMKKKLNLNAWREECA